MTPYDPARHHRRSIRLKGYDYTQPGAYFITLVTHERAPLFGAVVDGVMRLNAWGEIVREEWFKTAHIRPYVRLYEDECVVMPNHVHGIIWMVENNDDTAVGNDNMVGNGDVVGARRRRAPTSRRAPAVSSCPDHVEQFGKPVPGSIPTIVRAFKSAITKRINELHNTPGAPIWQRNYYEHVIRDERALNAIRQYITENPLRWHLDTYNPDRTGDDLLAREIWNTIQPHPKINRDA
ncbi:transposase [Methylothermus subterraneus]